MGGKGVQNREDETLGGLTLTSPTSQSVFRLSMGFEAR
ncbi:MAG: hypothetical protein AVDCRST_MAG93-782 [uncultured Chloroflexia bacterium]|uniref:Uncharacterized protein n=1 Tax=uncultured Chloroflexia bacterium TaxID=1672391 RepID=A0A6J4HNN7_9CHLR|nr:MAG: hypothetical protein AVDCRST_MAG93-782 [uncultured Chloroflexia bacterium]